MSDTHKKKREKSKPSAKSQRQQQTNEEAESHDDAGLPPTNHCGRCGQVLPLCTSYSNPRKTKRKRKRKRRHLKSHRKQDAASRGSSPAPPVKKKLTTRRAAKVFRRRKMIEDGAWAYLRLPLKRKQETLKDARGMTNEVAQSCKKAGIREIQRIKAYNPRGFVLQFGSHELLTQAVRHHKCFALIKGGFATLNVYHTSGPRVWYSDNIRADEDEWKDILIAISRSVGTDKQFWAAEKHCISRMGQGCILVFASPVEQFRLDVPIRGGPGKGGYTAQFFRQSMLMYCILCGGDHPVHQCETSFKPLKFKGLKFLLEEKPNVEE
ncbi:hypothetical protein GGS21DRAFT_494259 [Xylaria nigripes]|nr:hypothetical protein GGS21DRAFT_494259 [Xylaria nigripes]